MYIKKYLFLLFCSVFFSMFFNCKKEEVQEKKEQTKKEESLPNLNERILLILGEDYYKKTDILKCLEKEYNLASINDNVQILPYDLLMVKDFLRLKFIEEKIDEFKPDVVISLGLPERAGKYLLAAVSEYPTMVVITAFAMEEIAKLEAASDIVLDFTLPDELLNPEHDFYVSDAEISLVLLSSVLSSKSIISHGKNSGILPIEDAKEGFKKASEILADSLGHNEYTLKPYVDTDIGMASYNYIMIHKTIVEEDDSDGEF